MKIIGNVSLLLLTTSFGLVIVPAMLYGAFIMWRVIGIWLSYLL